MGVYTHVQFILATVKTSHPDTPAILEKLEAKTFVPQEKELQNQIDRLKNHLECLLESHKINVNPEVLKVICFPEFYFQPITGAYHNDLEALFFRMVTELFISMGRFANTLFFLGTIPFYLQDAEQIRSKIVSISNVAPIIYINEYNQFTSFKKIKHFLSRSDFYTYPVTYSGVGIQNHRSHPYYESRPAYDPSSVAGDHPPLSSLSSLQPDQFIILQGNSTEEFYKGRIEPLEVFRRIPEIFPQDHPESKRGAPTKIEPQENYLVQIPNLLKRDGTPLTFGLDVCLDHQKRRENAMEPVDIQIIIACGASLRNSFPRANHSCNIKTYAKPNNGYCVMTDGLSITCFAIKNELHNPSFVDEGFVQVSEMRSGRIVLEGTSQRCGLLSAEWTDFCMFYEATELL